jgi:hypothetical protein
VKIIANGVGTGCASSVEDRCTGCATDSDIGIYDKVAGFGQSENQTLDQFDWELARV